MGSISCPLIRKCWGEAAPKKAMTRPWFIFFVELECQAHSHDFTIANRERVSFISNLVSDSTRQTFYIYNNTPCSFKTGGQGHPRIQPPPSIQSYLQPPPTRSQTHIIPTEATNMQVFCVFNAITSADRRTNGWTDQWTDRPMDKASYRVACLLTRPDTRLPQSRAGGQGP